MAIPRTGRIKPRDEGAYYHIMNRIVGEPGNYPFGDVERETVISLRKNRTIDLTES